MCLRVSLTQTGFIHFMGRGTALTVGVDVNKMSLQAQQCGVTPPGSCSQSEPLLRGRDDVMTR